MQLKSAKQLFDLFPGIWKITRRVTATLPAQNAIAHGYGLFIVSKDTPDLILYSEKVAIHHSNTTHIGRQQYQYIYDRASASLSKYFHDGRFFYRLNLQNGQISGTHLCIGDNYLSNYTFEPDRDKFSITYAVNGPLKCYGITTVYTRMPYKKAMTLGV